ncbi:MAG TPA: metallophosphoesterase [Candidatus Binatia bacterium]|nr:metallophosphoesterase [Candidatus Binatia bacterium]
MRLAIRDPELFGVTETTATVTFVVAGPDGPVDAPARVLVDGVERAVSEGPAGTRLVRVDGLSPGTTQRLEIVPGARGSAAGDAASPDPYFPGDVTTLPAPTAKEVASFATLNDLHFGESRFGGTLLPGGDYGDPAPGFPEVHESEGDVPYWLAMNEDAVADINAAGVDAVVVKGDIADRGRRDQFEIAARTFARFRMPHHAFLGNHDHYGLLAGDHVDGYPILGQPPAPRAVDLGGWRLLLLDTVEPGHHHGVFGDDRMRWLADALAETGARSIPTLLVMHHQPVAPEHRDRFPNTIGLLPEHSLPFADLVGRNPQVKGVLIGHTHRNKLHRFAGAPGVPFVEVSCVKDYPGSFAVYRLFSDGSFRQEVRRIASARALAHSTRCREFFDRGYRRFALGALAHRSFVAGGAAQR